MKSIDEMMTMMIIVDPLKKNTKVTVLLTRHEFDSVSVKPTVYLARKNLS